MFICLRAILSFFIIRSNKKGKRNRKPPTVKFSFDVCLPTCLLLFLIVSKENNNNNNNNPESAAVPNKAQPMVAKEREREREEQKNAT